MQEPERLSDTDIAQGLELCERATPIEYWSSDIWFGESDGGWAATGPHHAGEEDYEYNVPGCDSEQKAQKDSRFIAASRTLLPKALRELQELRKGSMTDTVFSKLNEKFREISQLLNDAGWIASNAADQSFESRCEAAESRLAKAVEALNKITKKRPNQVNQLEAADMAVEFHMVARQALKEIEGDAK